MTVAAARCGTQSGINVYLYSSTQAGNVTEANRNAPGESHYSAAIAPYPISALISRNSPNAESPHSRPLPDCL